MSVSRIGIIGLGLVSKVHLASFKLVKDIRIVAVCDVGDEVVRPVAEDWCAAAYTDYEVMLQSNDFDLVLVLTPASTHRKIVAACANEGVHVFCEKPLAVSREDAQAIVSDCAKAQIKLFYGSCYRYLPAVRRAYDLIRKGRIGDIKLLTEQGLGGSGPDGHIPLSFLHYPEGQPGGSGSGLIDHGIHLVDIFKWFVNSPIMDVKGRGNVSGKSPQTEYLIMHFANGAMGHLVYNDATFKTTLPQEGIFSKGQSYRLDGTIADSGLWEDNPASISVYGTEGSLRIFYYANALYLNNGRGVEEISLTGRAPFGHFATQLETCLDAIASNKLPEVSGDDGLDALSTVLEIYS